MTKNPLSDSGHYVNARQGTIEARNIKTSVKSAKITLSGNKTVNATVKYAKAKEVG